MTMTPLDPPGPCAYDEVIDVELSSDPLLLAIEYLTGSTPNDGGWDVVYADGRFSYRYRTSSRDGNTWHIRPPGGHWPCPFRLHYEPATMLPTRGQTWGAIYDLSFAAQPSQSIGASGPFTIAGLQWYAKGSTSKVSSALVNGSGLVFTNTTAIGATMNAASILADRHLFLPLSAIPDYEPTAPLLVFARMTQNGNTSTTGPWIGLVDSTNDGVELQAAARQTEAWAGIEQSASKQIAYKLGTSSFTYTTSAGTGLSVAGILRPCRQLSIPVAAASSGEIPAPDAFKHVAAGATTSSGSLNVIDPTTRANPGLAFFFSCSGSIGSAATFHWLRVMQPKAAA